MERISDSSDWSYYLKSYSNGEYFFRHNHSYSPFRVAGTVDRQPYPDPQELADVGCDRLKNEVGIQLSLFG